VSPDSSRAGAQPDLRIAIARDRAFGFYYPDDLAALQAAGAELVFFDTLHDANACRRLDGLFIGGGFPEACMDANWRPTAACAKTSAPGHRSRVADGMPNAAA
jgi:cobyrinic acid a,c-diamide synthase